MAREKASTTEEPRKRKRAAARKPGLLHPLRAVEIQDVRKVMKLCCSACTFQPRERRLFVRTGSGRYGKQEVFCISCGVEWLVKREREVTRARAYLRWGLIPGAPNEPTDAIRL